MNNTTWNRVANSAAFQKSPLSQDELQQYRELIAQHPLGIYHNTLATAEYRMSNFKKAIAAALKSVELLPKEDDRYDNPFPGDYAILAMSHFKLGEKEKADEYREKLTEAMKQDAFKDDTECQSFAKEVAKLLKPPADDTEE